MRSVSVGSSEDRSMVGEGEEKDLEMGHGTTLFLYQTKAYRM